MRAEVVLLDRSITIIAETDYIGQTDFTGSNVDEEPWGCRVLVADWIDNGHELPEATGSYYPRRGEVHLDHVEVSGCSQRGTWRAAVQFTTATGGENNYITNSAIHSGKAVGVLFDRSANILFENNSVVDFVEHGIWAKGSSSLTINNNWIFHIWPQDYYFETGPVMFEYTGWTGCVTISDQNFQYNSKLVVTNNVAASCWHHGFHYQPLDCDEVVDENTHTKFENNIAHSVSGYGAIAANVQGNPACTEVKDFTAYKCTESSIHLGGNSDINRAKNIVTIDCGYGLGIHGSGCGSVEAIDCKIYGENRENYDCPDGSCDSCIDRYGLTLAALWTDVHRDKETEHWEFLPIGNYSDCFTAKATYTNIEFHRFESGTVDGDNREANEASCDGAR